jgi:hypothetical protein
MPLRQAMFQKLDKKIKLQLTPEVEYLVSSDDGELTIGTKRELLKQQATGDYIVYVDDDDHISRYYVRNILEAIEQGSTVPGGVDTIGIKGFQTTNLKEMKYFECSSKYKKWNELRGGLVVKPVNHINPIKREIALNAKFPDLYYGEDKFYSEAIKPYLVTEVLADGWLYWYDYRPGESQSVAMDIKDRNKGLKLLHAAGFN